MRTPVKKTLVAFLCSAALLAGCGGNKSNNSPPAGPDTTPDAFSFTDQAGVVASSEITSAPVTITGINAAAGVTVAGAGGSYSVGCTATYVSTAGTISNNETVCVRHTSAAATGTATNTVLTVGGVSDTFTSTTAGIAVTDTTPDQYSFTDQAGVALSTVTTSAAVTITGINEAAAVTVAGGTYSVGCTATYVDTAGTITNGQTVCARHTSSASAGTSTNTTLTVGGVSDIFTSTTAGTSTAAGKSLPFLTGAGELKLLTTSATSTQVDSGLTPAACVDCLGPAKVFLGGTVSGTIITNLHAARMVYPKGGMVYKVDLSEGAASNQPVRLSSITDACEIVDTETTNVAAMDTSAVAVLRGASCNIVTVIRLNTPATDAGVDISLVLEAGHPLHAQTDATGAVTGYVSFELSGSTPLLVRRDANLGNPVTLLTLDQTGSANIERAGLTNLFVTAQSTNPTTQNGNLKLYRVESGGTLSPELYIFGFTPGENPLQGGLHDASNLYFTDENLALRIPLNSTSANATVIATLSCATPASCLRILGNRALDSSTTPGRVVFEAHDESFSMASGVFSAATDGSTPAGTALVTKSEPEAFVILLLATGGFAYINVDHHTSVGNVDALPDAIRISTAGPAGSGTTITSAYWAGSSGVSSYDYSQNSAVPPEYLYLARHEYAAGIGDDTLYVVTPASGAVGHELGKILDVGAFLAVKITGLGQYVLASAEMDRDGNLDNDVYFLNATAAGSLAPAAQTTANDIPLGR